MQLRTILCSLLSFHIHAARVEVTSAVVDVNIEAGRRRRRGPGRRVIRTCDESTEANNVPQDLKGTFETLEYIGQGANACVYVGDGTLAIKTAKKSGQLELWKDECQRQQTLHAAVCGKDPELQEAVDNYLPACTAVGGTDQDPWLTMHAVGGGKAKRIQEVARKLPAEYQESIFAQLVAAIRTMHAVGWSHNDLHDANIMVDVPGFLLKRRRSGDPPPPPIGEAAEIPRLSLIDFGDILPLTEAWTEDYKRDSNAIWSRGAVLAACDRSVRWSRDATREDATAFVDCLSEKWTIDEEFKAALWTVIDASLNKDKDQQVEQLFQTSWVQSRLPSAKRQYSSDVCNE